MRETKIVEIDGKTFKIIKLDCVAQLKLLINIIKLCGSTNTIKSAITQNHLLRLFKINTNDKTNEAELQALIQMQEEDLIAHVISSILVNLDDVTIDFILNKVFGKDSLGKDTVLYVNGVVESTIKDAFQLEIISDVVMLISLLKEVILFTFNGAIDRAKKLELIPQQTAE
jgi:hypothetical protein